jgi:hypothetical protein
MIVKIEKGDKMSEAQQPDALKKLVIFIIALAIMMTIIALGWYFTMELPIQQAALHAPMNMHPLCAPNCRPH